MESISVPMNKASHVIKALNIRKGSVGIVTPSMIQKYGDYRSNYCSLIV
jgi:hypothetical protein